MLMREKHLLTPGENKKQILRGVYPEPLLPLCGIRAVRKWRANGLRMTVELLRLLIKRQGDGIDAITQTGGAGAVRKHVAQVGVALAAENFHPPHPMA
jgi:hypothetical protein